MVLARRLMPYTHRLTNGRVVAWAWSSPRDVIQRRFDGPDAEACAKQWGARMAASLAQHSSPRTCGQAARQVQRLCQTIAAYGTKPIHSPEAQRYWRAVFDEATDILQELRGEPPDAPMGGRLAAVECSAAGCDATIWVPARQLWDERQSGREFRRRCTEHAPDPVDSSPPPAVNAQGRDELAEAAVGRLLALAPQVFREPDETMAAWVEIGKWERLVHAWECNLRLLQYNAGGRSEAWERLRGALDEADLLHLLDLPPLPDPPEPEPEATESPEHAPEPEPEAEPEPEPEPEPPTPTNPLESWSV